MNYLKAVHACIFGGWSGIFHDENVYGNGITILWHGISMILAYIAYYIFRVVVVLTAPVSALYLMYVDAKHAEWYEQAVRELDEDL